MLIIFCLKLTSHYEGNVNINICFLMLELLTKFISDSITSNNSQA